MLRLISNAESSTETEAGDQPTVISG